MRSFWDKKANPVGNPGTKVVFGFIRSDQNSFLI